MTRSETFNPLLRAVLVVGAVAAIVTGVTFAALQSSTASLTGNTLSSATAELKISNSGTSFSDSRAGYDFTDIIPGGAPAPAEGNPFWLHNDGTADLSLTATILDTLATIPADLDLTKVHLVITDPGANEALGGGDDIEELSATLDELTTVEVSLATDLEPATGTDGKKYFLQAVIDADAFDGDEASVGEFDLVFKGTNAAETE